MKKSVTFLSVVLMLLFTNQPVRGIVDPRKVPNNRFGIHTINESDVSLAQDLVNSNAGEWGYVTIVIREDDRNQLKWQAMFDELRRRNLIPLVRIATKIENGGWAKPRQKDLDSWVDFLSALNWVVQNRYVILFNEPNHAAEWGGEVRPDEYASFVRLLTERLKEVSEDFFVLPAGFDAAATDTPTSMDSAGFFTKMHEQDPEVFKLFDGWVSHSYPNPEFSGSPWDSGKTSIRGYIWETSYLTKFGLKSDIPIFISETGWKHREGVKTDPTYPTAEKVSEFFSEAFQNVWTDQRIVAITPFVLRYPEEPFAHFSWVGKDDQAYPQYQTIKSLPKEKGRPEQLNEMKLKNSTIPSELVINSKYTFSLDLENTGQSIWSQSQTSLLLTSTLPDQEVTVLNVPYTEPFTVASLNVKLVTPNEKEKTHSLTVRLVHDGKLVRESLKWEFTLIPPPRLIIRSALGTKLTSSGEDFTLLIYQNGDLVKKVMPLSMTNGIGVVNEVYDVVPSRSYRFVLLKSYYLPRQTFAYLSPQQTTVSFKRLLPLDPNADGTLTLLDFPAAFRHLPRTVGILWPFTD